MSSLGWDLAGKGKLILRSFGELGEGEFKFDVIKHADVGRVPRRHLRALCRFIFSMNRI